MSGRRKPLVWNWPPVSGRNGTPKQAIQADIIEGTVPPPEETAGITGDQPALTEQDKTVEYLPYPNADESPSDPEIVAAAEGPADSEITAAAESPATDTTDMFPIPVEAENVKPFVGAAASSNGPGEIIYPPHLELAKAYIPYQTYGPTYSPREALEKGTLFPALYRPYL